MINPQKLYIMTIPSNGRVIRIISSEVKFFLSFPYIDICLTTNSLNTHTHIYMYNLYNIYMGAIYFAVYAVNRTMRVKHEYLILKRNNN